MGYVIIILPVRNCSKKLKIFGRECLWWGRESYSFCIVTSTGRLLWLIISGLKHGGTTQDLTYYYYCGRYVINTYSHYYTVFDVCDEDEGRTLVRTDNLSKEGCTEITRYLEEENKYSVICAKNTVYATVFTWCSEEIYLYNCMLFF